MPRLTIDGRGIEVPAGATLLDAATALGIAIPTICHLRGVEPCTSCYVCVVQVKGRAGLSPACATAAEEGLEVDASGEAVRLSRRTALELLLSDHVGDCEAPCTLACPAHLEVADFIYHLTRGDRPAAAAVIRRRLALPASLSYVCPRFCENACRRKGLDEPVRICQLRRAAVEAELAGEPSSSPPTAAGATGRSIVIVGAGPAGLAAAYYLRQAGHEVTILEARPETGGMFRYGLTESQLPRQVLQAEVAAVLRLGVTLRTGVQLGRDVSLAELRREHGAVIIATGLWPANAAPTAAGESWRSEAKSAKLAAGPAAMLQDQGLEASGAGLKVDRHTLATNLPGVFAAGSVTGGPNYGVQALASGRLAAVIVGQFLDREPLVGEPRKFHVLMHHLSEVESARLYECAARPAVVAAHSGAADRHRSLADDEARAEAARCLDCDCGKKDHCLLRDYAHLYGASSGHFHGQRREFQRDASHDEIVYESGKCVQCGLCLRVADQHHEKLGLTFVGRGFDVKMQPPFDVTMAEALGAAGRACAAACPTGALSLKRPRR